MASKKLSSSHPLIKTPMNLDQQVVSLETAKRLKELGVKQESYFYFILHGEEWQMEGRELFDAVDGEWGCGCSVEDLEHISAFTSGELGEMLPWRLKNLGTLNNAELVITKLVNVEGTPLWNVAYWDEDKGLYNGMVIRIKNEPNNLADAMGKMLIYLIENKLITL